MIDAHQIIVANVAGWGAALFFVKLWINGVNQRLDRLTEKLEGKVSEPICCERMKVLRENIKNHEEISAKSLSDIFTRIRHLESEAKE